MKILFLVPFTRLRKENAEAVHVREVAENLAALGHDVTLVSSGESAAVKGVRRETVRSFGGGALRVLSCAAFGFAKGLRLLRREKFDVIYERHYPLGIGVLLGKITGTPCVAEVNGFWTDEARLSGSALKRFFSSFPEAEFMVSGNAGRLVAVTPVIARALEREWRIPREKISVVENGVNTRLFSPAGKRGGCKTVCFVGSLAPWQGVEELIEAAPFVARRFPDARFLIVGDGALRGELERSVEAAGLVSNFQFVGSVPYRDVPRYVNDSDVCVALKRPLKSGYSPLKLYEYLACGKPIVASRVAGFEVLEKERLGLLVDSRKPKEVASAIIHLLSDGKTRREMGARGRKFVVEKHSWKKAAGNVARACADASNRHGS